jgi:hypothetical protein
MNRTDVLDYLVRHHSQWPTTLEEALYASRDDDHPTASQDVEWSCTDSSGEVVLRFAVFDYITHEEWSQARRERLNRPEDWPAGARILVQNSDGMWIFGTMEYANPLEDGGWGADVAEHPGTWLFEGRTQGSTEIAGWDWTCSMITREDAMIDSLDHGEPEEIEEAFEEKADVAAPEWMVEPAADAHYAGMVLRIDLTEVDRQRGYAEVRLDPYRMSDFYGIGGGPREQVFKKVIRGTSKGGTERDLVRDIRSAVDRWEQMLDENERIFTYS